MLIIFLLSWFAAGCFSFWYWYTSDFDLTLAELWLLLVAGLPGPLSWLIGWGLHGWPTRASKLALFRKR